MCVVSPLFAVVDYHRMILELPASGKREGRNKLVKKEKEKEMLL